MKGTMICVSVNTRETLKKLKKYRRESYDEVITRLVSQQYDENFLKINDE